MTPSTKVPGKRSRLRRRVKLCLHQMRKHPTHALRMGGILCWIGLGLLFPPASAEAADTRIVPSDWQIIDQGDQHRPSSWTYDRGVWYQTSNIYGGPEEPSALLKPGTFMVSHDSVVSDGTIRADIASDGDDAIGIMFRYRDEDNYYRFSMDKQRSYRRLLKIVDGVATVLGEDRGGYDKGRWYGLEIHATGPHIRVLLDGQLIFDVSDASLEKGKMALYFWGNTLCQFRDISVASLRGVPSETTTPGGKSTVNLKSPREESGSPGIPAPETGPSDTATEPPAIAVMDANGPAYIIGPGDVLDISVWRDDALTKQVVVLPDGRISFPLIGEVAAAGKTLAQLKTELAERLEVYVPNPELNVAIEGVGSMVIYLIGKVNGPGRYPIGQDLDVLKALAMAGGLTPFAKNREIRIFRKEGDRTQIFYFNYNEVAEGKRLEQNIDLRRGDVIVVP